jgi:hypothetical protein
VAIVDHESVRSGEPEFARRAAYAWIRAADAGLIDADELAWLLDHLPSSAFAAQPRISAGGTVR